MYERLTLKALADAAGLDLATTRRYCREFAAALDSAGQEGNQRWAPISVATLKTIAAMEAAGYSIDAIHRELGIERGILYPEQHTTELLQAPAVPERSADPSMLLVEADSRTNDLRDKLRARQAEQAATAKPWWRFWKR
jgi:hypothetical protein